MGRAFSFFLDGLATGGLDVRGIDRTADTHFTQDPHTGLFTRCALDEVVVSGSARSG